MTKQPAEKKPTNSPRRHRKSSTPVPAIEPAKPPETEAAPQSSSSNRVIAPSCPGIDSLNGSNHHTATDEKGIESQWAEPVQPPVVMGGEGLTPPLTELVQLAAPLVSPSSTLGAIAENSSVSPTSAWQTTASFTVTVQHRSLEESIEYQTVIHHLDSGETITCPGMETRQLHHWIETHFTQPNSILTPTTTQPEPDWRSLAPALGIKVKQLQITQLDQTGTVMVVDQTNQAFLSPIPSHQPFTLTVAFEVVGLNHISPTTFFSYVTQVYARHRYTGLTLPLSSLETTELVEQGPYYQASLPEVMFEEPGLYRLQILVNVRQVKVPSGFFEIPMLQVI